jgi:5-(carboxyamino)imidazole ribonucleotide synthase
VSELSAPSPPALAQGRRGPLIGVLGAGQLGRMLALAGYPLGLEFLFVDPAAEAPASACAEQIAGDYDDDEVLARLAACDAVTYEFENVPVEAVRRLAERVPCFPPARALEVAQDRLAEKTCFRKLAIPTPEFAAVDTRAELEAAVRAIGLPAVLKTRRFGYDGKGQAVLRAPDDVDRAWQQLGGTPLILEAFVPFERELSLVAARSRGGETAFYPLVQNRHSGGILRETRAPAPDLAPELQALAEGYVARLLGELDYVGVLALELFCLGGKLLANELAPRVHNSGHWTIEGAITSQFENHLRAVLGLPLGSAAATGPSAMLNLIGTAVNAEAVLGVPDAHLHWYGKEPRPGRKVGHVTVRAPDTATLETRLARLRSSLDSEATSLV